MAREPGMRVVAARQLLALAMLTSSTSSADLTLICGRRGMQAATRRERAHDGWPCSVYCSRCIIASNGQAAALPPDHRDRAGRQGRHQTPAHLRNGWHLCQQVGDAGGRCRAVHQHQRLHAACSQEAGGGAALVTLAKLKGALRQGTHAAGTTATQSMPAPATHMRRGARPTASRPCRP